MITFQNSNQYSFNITLDFYQKNDYADVWTQSIFHMVSQGSGYTSDPH